MVHPGAALFEKGDDDHDLTALGQALECFSRWAGNRFSQAKVPVIFALAKILGREKFLRTNNVRPFRSSLFNLGQGGLKIRGRITVGFGLD